MKVYPALVGVGKSVYVVPYVTVLVVGLTLHPFALNVSVYVHAVPFAFNVFAAHSIVTVVD